MRKLILTTAIALLSMAAAPAPAKLASNEQPKQNEQAQSAEAPAAKISDAAETKVCRLLPSSYSHRSDRVCLTKSQWKQVDEDTQN
jgi:hypothetical protein